jgi:hypothetical protein
MRYRWVLALSVAVVLLVGPTLAKDPRPVIQDLGPLVPTPAPSPVRAERIRLISSFTLQNKPDGDSIISFEATDFARVKGKKEEEEEGKKEEKEESYRTLAVELYSLGTPKKEAREARARIMNKIRDLERELLGYVEIVGPPREREPLTGAPGMQPAR